MGFLDRFRREPPLKQDNLLGLRDDPESQAGPANEGEQAVPAARMEAVEPAAETRPEAMKAKPERMSIQQITELGAQRAQAAQTRRAETRAKLWEGAKNFGRRVKGGIKTGQALYHARGEFAAEAGARVADYGASKSEQAGKALERGINSLADRVDAAHTNFNNKADQAHNFVMAKYAEMKERKRSAREAALLKQRSNLFDLHHKLTLEIEHLQMEKMIGSSPEMTRQTA